MRKLLALTLLAAGLIVAAATAATPSPVSAASCYNVQVFNNNPQNAYASCYYLAPGGEGAHGGEKVRVYIYCKNAAGAWWGGGYGTPSFGPWRWVAEQHSDAVCNLDYPIVGFAGYETGTGP